MFEYDILARSGRRTVADTSPKSKINSSRSAPPAKKQQNIISKHQENLVKEVSDLLSKARDGTSGEDSTSGLRNMGRTMMASLKDRMGGGAGGGTTAAAPPSPQPPPPPPRTLQPADLGQEEDPKAKYMDKVKRLCTWSEHELALYYGGTRAVGISTPFLRVLRPPCA